MRHADHEIIESNVELLHFMKIKKTLELDRTEPVRSRACTLLYCAAALVTVTWKLTSQQLKVTGSVQTQFIQNTHTGNLLS